MLQTAQSFYSMIKTYDQQAKDTLFQNSLQLDLNFTVDYIVKIVEGLSLSLEVNHR